MGRQILQEDPAAQALARAASDRLGIDLVRLCLDAPVSELQQTENAQPALLLVSLALLGALQRQGLRPQAAAGHSMGEYAALVAAEALEPLDALALVRERGLAMATAKEGAMAAVIGLADQEVEAACAEAGEGVVAANYNAPGQVVISGPRAGVERATQLLQARGARRIVPLKIGGAFHSPLVAPAADRLRVALEQATLRPLQIPVAFNVDAGVYQDVASVRRLMLEQLTAPVRWVQCIQTLWDRGVRTFVEVGPQQTLTGLIRRITPEAILHNVEDLDSLRAVAAGLQ
jgi:[acyl-carrier-protein] S-malonyltransferase